MFGYLRWTWNELIIADELITTNAEPSEADGEEEVIKSKDRSILEECSVFICDFTRTHKAPPGSSRGLKRSLLIC